LRQGEVDFSVAKEADIAAMMSEVKILGVFSETKLDTLPDVPTLGSLGYYDKWYGSARAIVAPKGTKPEVIAFYEEAFKKAMEDPEYIAAAEKAGVTTLFMNAEDTGRMIQQQYEFCTNEVAKLWE
jgi:tripartite-type tricarboxylate transporter receptor subunit TctC